MKRFLTLFLLLNLPVYSQGLSLQTEWEWQNPTPQGNDLRNVWVKDHNVIFAVGDRGTFMRSDNAGIDWEINFNFMSILEDIVDMQFINDEKGWLLANQLLTDDYGNMLSATSKILLTADGGINWNIIGSFDSLILNDLIFIDENVGWTAGYSNDTGELFEGLILKTIDGGFNWDTLFSQSVTGNLSSEYTPYNSIQFLDSDTGWITSKNPTSTGAFYDGALLQTTNGGLTWDTINDTISYIIDFQFLNSNIGWLIQYTQGGWGTLISEYKILKTTDGGFSWDVLFEKTYSNHRIPIPSLYFINEAEGWISEPVEQYSNFSADLIHKTIDGGLTWLTDTIKCPFNGAMHFIDEKYGCIVGKNGQISSTSDGGQTWIPRSTLAFDEDLISIDFINQDIGWVVADEVGLWGPGGKIFKTTNSGLSWQEQLYIPSSYGSTGFAAVQAVSDQIVYAAETGIYKSTNSGDSWNQLNTIEDWNFTALCFLDKNTGFVGSSRGSYRIYKTIDGGISWNDVLTSNSTIQSIFFINDFVGWAVGAGNLIYKTIDGGNNWKTIPIMDDTFLRSVYFSDLNNGLATGKHWNGVTEEGIIFQSTDSGDNWDLVYSSQEYKFNSVHFTDSLHGFVVGSGSHGIILATTDGGKSWNRQFNNVKSLEDIYFTNGNLGWAVGEDGTILTTTREATFIHNKQIDELAADFTLSQNYPNPFNPTTTIKYSVPSNTKRQTAIVKLVIFDILGREVAVLVNEEQKPGYYEIEWDASGFSSGVYFYKILADSFVETKKMVLLR